MIRVLRFLPDGSVFIRIYFFIRDKNTNIKANLHILYQSNIIMISISGFSEGRYNADSNSRKLRPLITLCFHDK
jgi:hypothetical protein